MGVWPENWDSVQVFISLGTQWTVGPGGPIGLVYASLPVVLRRWRIPLDRRDAVFDDLQVMEGAALEEMRQT